MLEFIKKRKLEYIAHLLDKYPNAFRRRFGLEKAIHVDTSNSKEVNLYTALERYRSLEAVLSELQSDNAKIRLYASVAEPEMARLEKAIIVEREEREKKEQEIKYNSLEKECPNGLRLYKERHQSCTIKEILRAEQTISRLELVYKDSLRLHSVVAAQSDVVDFCIKQRKQKMQDWWFDKVSAHYQTDAVYGVPEMLCFVLPFFYRAPFSNDTTQDYTLFPLNNKAITLIHKFERGESCVSNAVYDNVIIYLQAVQSPLVILGDSGHTGNDSFIKSSNYDYFKEQLELNAINYCHFSEKDVISSSTAENIIVFEIVSSTSRLQENCYEIIGRTSPRTISITNISIFRELSSNEMSEFLKRIQESKKRKEEITKRLKDAVSSWGLVPSSSLHHKFLIRYYPTTCDFEATDAEWDNRQLIWAFKNDPNKNKRISHQQALNKLIPRVKCILEETFGNYLSNLTLVCIPASSPEKNKARYELFSRLLCQTTGMTNAFTHMTINAERVARHDGGTAGETDSITFDTDFFKEKNILLFDDILTRGDSMRKFERKMSALGAKVIAGFTIGKTFHNREEVTPTLTQNTSSNHEVRNLVEELGISL